MDKTQPDFGLAEKIGYLAIIGFLAFMVPAQHQYQRVFKAVAFGKQLQLALLITLIASVLVAGADTFYTQVFYPEFMSDYSLWQLKELKANGASASDIERFQAEMKEYPTGAGFMFLIMFITVFVIGAVMGLISSAIIPNFKKPVSN